MVTDCLVTARGANRAEARSPTIAPSICSAPPQPKPRIILATPHSRLDATSAVAYHAPLRTTSTDRGDPPHFPAFHLGVIMALTYLLRSGLGVPQHVTIGSALGISSVRVVGTLSLSPIALALLVAGAIALVMNPRDRLVRLFALLMLDCAIVVIAFPLSRHFDPWGRAIEGGANGLAAALWVRFCVAFPDRKHQLIPRRRLARVVYERGSLVPVAASLFYIVSSLASGWPSVLGTIFFCLGIIFGITLGLVVLARTFLAHPQSDLRSAILVVWVGGALTFLPLIAVNVVPALFLHPSLVPFPDSEYALIILPLAVGFATVRWRTTSLLTLIDRVSVYLLLAIVLLGCYAILALAVAKLNGSQYGSLPGLLPLAIAIIAATTFAPLRARIQRFVDTALYRDYYDLGQTLQRFSQSLATVRDKNAVASSLLDELSETLNLSGAALVLLPGGLDPAVLRLIEPDDLITRRAYASADTCAQLVRELSQLDEDRLRISQQQPLILDPFPGCEALVVIGPGGNEDVSALLLVGMKHAGRLRPEDRALLGTVAHQAATALENATLIGGLHTTLSQLRRSTDQLEVARAEQQLLLRELVDADERQRAALARDLHDDALQDLMYVSRHSRYCLDIVAAQMRSGDEMSPAAQRVRDEMDQLAQAAAASERKLRDLCAGLYPALIESLGLRAAIEALPEDVTALGDLVVEAECDPESEPLAAALSSDARLHVYRIAQEAVRNASRHAHAHHVTIRLAATSGVRQRPQSTTALPRNRLVLTVSDDGCGIELPIDYVRLLQNRHLGLANMRERADRIGADLKLEPSAAGGTKVVLTIPVSSLSTEMDVSHPHEPQRQIAERALPEVPVPARHADATG